MGPDLGSNHLPMLPETRTTPSRERTVRKPRWAFKRADWETFRAECEEALSEPPSPPRATSQTLITKFAEVVLAASQKHVPRGARADSKH